MPVIEEILSALGVPSVRADRYEADDVIATLAEGCRATKRPVLDPLRGQGHPAAHRRQRRACSRQERGATDLVEYSREKVFEVKGVYPEQIVDFLALTGDSSDNVPGVPGHRGEDGAEAPRPVRRAWTRIYAKLDEVAPESLRKKLEAGRESAMLSRELVTLSRDVPGLPERG